MQRSALSVSCLAATLLICSVARSEEGLTKANSRQEADIYASGTLIGALNARTVYSWDTKFAYRYFIHRFSLTNWDIRARPMLEFVTNQGTRSSPDKVNLGGELALARTKRQLGITQHQFVLNPRGEFNRKFDTRSFVAGTFWRAVFVSLPGPTPKWINFAPIVELGIESGHNFTNKLQKQGSGAIARLYAAVSSTFWHRMNEKHVMEVTYQYRGPLHDEIFTERAEAPEIRYLSKKPRHYLEVGFKVPLTDFIALKPQYKWGSLPPAFSFLDSQYTLNLEVSAKRK